MRHMVELVGNRELQLKPEVVMRATCIFGVALSLLVTCSARAISVPPLPPGSYQGHSFFDVFVDGAPVSSFFDVFFDVSVVQNTPLPDGNWAVDSFFDITYRIGSVDHRVGPGHVTLLTSPLMPAGAPGTFDTEMLSMDLASGPFMIRESPTKQSLGRVTMSAPPGGTFHIDSFFDIFTELSLDGGQTWSPSLSSEGNAAPMHLAPPPGPGVPVPAAVWTGLALLGGLAGYSRIFRKTA